MLNGEFIPLHRDRNLALDADLCRTRPIPAHLPFLNLLGYLSHQQACDAVAFYNRLGRLGVGRRADDEMALGPGDFFATPHGAQHIQADSQLIVGEVQGSQPRIQAAAQSLDPLGRPIFNLVQAMICLPQKLYFPKLVKK